MGVKSARLLFALKKVQTSSPPSPQVSKRWYDYERMSLHFIKIAKELQHSPLVFKHHQDFDENGILYWIGSNARCVHTYVHTNHVSQHTNAVTVGDRGKV